MIQKYFYTYVLESIKDRNIYIGYTDNLSRRIKQHNSGKVFATKSRLPLLLIYYEACLDKEKAIEREKSLKTGFGRNYLKNRLK